MNGSLWLWGALAVTLFWGVGVYNRLMRMQVRGVAALRSVEKHVQRCAKLIDLHVSHIAEARASNHPSTSCVVTPSLAHLLEMMRNLDQALKDAKGTPLVGSSVARVGFAFEAAQSAWRQWCDEQLTPDGLPVPAAMCVQWEGATLKVQTTREGLNQILSKYNEAIDQFPARLLVGVMGFKPAGLM